MSAQDQLRRMAKLGIPNFETIKKVRRLQADMLARLERSSVDPDRYAGLDDCRADYCGRVNCLEACPFGALRRRLRQVPAAFRLLEDARPPFHEVRIIRGVWSRPFGKLKESSMAAAKQLNRRALDSLYNHKLIAVGTFKASPAPPYEGDRWICEIHQIVAGASKEELDRAFSTVHDRGDLRSIMKEGDVPNVLMVKEVKALGPAISKVLRRDLQGWEQPFRTEILPSRPRKAQRREFYRWLLGLTPDARMIRYGCDRYLNKLEKQPRVLQPKVPKKRPYPYWLQRYQFGTYERDQMDKGGRTKNI